MSDGDYLIFPAASTTTDDGFLESRRPARLHENGSEREWLCDSTAEAKETAALWFGVTEWTRDDLGIWFSKGG